MYRDLKYKLEQYFTFSKNEFFQLILVTILFGFMLAFRNWAIPGSNELSLSYGLYSWLVSGAVFFISYLIYLSVIKFTAVWKGYVMEFEINKYILFIAILLTFLSDGKFLLLIPGGLYYKVLKKHKLGELKQGIKFLSLGYIGVVGAFILIIIASVFAPLFNSHMIFEKIVIVNLLIAVFSMLPVPHTSGFYIATISFISYLTFTAVIIISALFAYLEAGLLFTLFVALFSAIFTWMVAFNYLE